MNWFQSKLFRRFASITLSLSIVFSGAAFVAPHKTEASAATRANRVIAIGNHYLGTPYRWGASTHTTRVFDCSSFTKYVFSRVGVYLPRTSTPQAHRGRYVA